MQSKYKQQFEKLAALTPRPYRLRGATLLVEVMPKEELKTSGGIIIAKGVDQRATADDFRRGVGIVLLAGEGYTDGSTMDVSVGHVVLLPYNPMYLSEFPGLVGYTQNTLAVVNESDIIFSYHSVDEYLRAREAINNGIV